MPLLLACMAFTAPLQAQQSASKPELIGKYTKDGADTCIRCHDEDSEFPVFSIFKTRHAITADQRTPFGKLQCESCHGPGADHAQRIRPTQKRPPIIGFGDRATAAKQNEMCLGCHQDQARIAWQGSPHGGANVACANCHRVHASDDHVQETATQPEVCYTCHQRQRADFFKPSSHPVRAGQMACSECHKPHGSSTDKLLARPSLNQTCYDCHAEKRGPFLWEHAPVAEECTLCHTAHGSVHPALLTRRPPQLCQQCHAQAGHPSFQLTGQGLPDASPSPFVIAGACLNCHAQVHGSNHPSGVKLMR
jgi:DmsE family decaheme c-type cytochrome